jgi:hypothetical protein
MDSRQPLWLPRGSIRAIIALALTVATIVGIFVSMGTVESVPAPLAALLTLDGMVINTYFNDRRKEANS